MSNFEERLGSQLAAAEQRLVAAASPSRPRRRWRTRRGAVLALAGLTIAVPALAATEPWEPILGDPAHENTPAGTSDSPVPSDQRELLEVLRRPQNDADRGPEAEDLLANVGEEYRGVRLHSVRLLTSADGHHALLVPSEEHGVSPEPNRYEATDTLCIEHGSGSFCGDAGAVRSGAFLGGFEDNLLGLVPDDVAQVRLTFLDGSTRTTEVRENFFWVADVPQRERTVRRILPPGIDMPSTFTVQETPEITWLDADGQRIGPPTQPAG